MLFTIGRPSETPAEKASESPSASVASGLARFHHLGVVEIARLVCHHGHHPLGEEVHCLHGVRLCRADAKVWQLQCQRRFRCCGAADCQVTDPVDTVRLEDFLEECHGETVVANRFHSLCPGGGACVVRRMAACDRQAAGAPTAFFSFAGTKNWPVDGEAIGEIASPRLLKPL